MWEQQGHVLAEGFILYVSIINCVTVLPPSLTVTNLSEKMKIMKQRKEKQMLKGMDVALGRIMILFSFCLS